MKKVLARLLCIAILVVCLPAMVSAAESTVPVDTAPKNPNPNIWITILLVGLVCFAASVTTAVIVLKMKKKGESE